MEKKFAAFRVFATLFKIASVLIALGTVLAVLLTFVGIGAGDLFMRQYGIANSPVVAFILVIIIFIAGAFSAVGFFALGEAMYLLISLEENTRFTAIILRERFYPQPPAPQPAQPLQPVMPQPVQPPPPYYPPAV